MATIVYLLRFASAKKKHVVVLYSHLLLMQTDAGIWDMFAGQQNLKVERRVVTDVRCMQGVRKDTIVLVDEVDYALFDKQIVFRADHTVIGLTATSLDDSRNVYANYIRAFAFNVLDSRIRLGADRVDPERV